MKNTEEINRIMNGYQKVRPVIINELLKIPKNFTFHNLSHVLDVESSAETLCLLGEMQSGENKYWLVRTAALFHDIGYKDGSSKDHEERGAEYARSILPAYGYKPEEIYSIIGMIKATKLPQDPKNFLEQILADADVDNFGRDDFFDRGALLRQELKETCGVNKTDKEWYQGVLKLLENHKYHTPMARNLRDGKKMQNIQKLRNLVE